VLIEDFGTDHFYAADGTFSHAEAPWLSLGHALSDPLFRARRDEAKAEAFESAMASSLNDPPIVIDMEASVEALPLALHWHMQGSVGAHTLSSVPHVDTPFVIRTPFLSGLHVNQQRAAHPLLTTPVRALVFAHRYNHSKAAYAGMARTDPKAVWVYQTWSWLGGQAQGCVNHIATLLSFRWLLIMHAFF
jgi:hypothetical protein